MPQAKIHEDSNARLRAWREKKAIEKLEAERIEREEQAKRARFNMAENQARDAIAGMVQKWQAATGEPLNWQELRVWLAQQIEEAQTASVSRCASTTARNASRHLGQVLGSPDAETIPLFTEPEAAPVVDESPRVFAELESIIKDIGRRHGKTEAFPDQVRQKSETLPVRSIPADEWEAILKAPPATESLAEIIRILNVVLVRKLDNPRRHVQTDFSNICNL